MPEIGEKAPNFRLPSTKGEANLSLILGCKKRVVLAFYIEAGTPSCSQMILAFRDEFAILQELGVYVLGVSADTLLTQRNFEKNMGGFPFPLVSDETLETARRYQVLSDDGKRSRRAVFVIGEDGTIIHSIPWYQPGNPGQFLGIFQALGLEI